MFVYKATNKINDKVYIGITKRDIEVRIYEHEKAMTRHPKRKFYKALNKYGFTSFVWEILKVCSSEEELKESEMFFIEQYDSVENGYNLSLGGEGSFGRKLTEEHKRKISESHKGKIKHVKKWEITTPDGQILIIDNMAKFCRENGLHNGAMTEVAKGRVKQHLGYTCRHI